MRFVTSEKCAIFAAVFVQFQTAVDIRLHTGLSYVLDAIDVTAGTARLIRNEAAVDVRVSVHDDRMHFTRVTDTGGVTHTTVHFSKPTPDGGYRVVHSWHRRQSDPYTLSQYVGTCVVIG